MQPGRGAAYMNYMTRQWREQDVVRQLKGARRADQSIAGQFADHLRSNPEAILQAPTRADVMTQLSLRRRVLREAGYMPAGSGIADGSPRTTAGIDTWWESHFNRAEFAPKGSYHQMPDDFTPNMTRGNALSEHRRTHRMLYQGAGVAVRMPSATSIKRFSDSIGGQTFDLPIEAEFPGGTVSGFVRVTQSGVAAWSVSGVNLPEPGNAYVSEAVSAVLEARGPRMALPQIRSLLVRRRERIAAAGVIVKPIEHSTWIRGMGYNTANSQMVIQLGDRTYGYHVPKAQYETARDSWSPGKIYNELVKGRGRFEIAFHDTCGRFYDARKTHRCPSSHHDRTNSAKLQNLRVRKHVVGLLV